MTNNLGNKEIMAKNIKRLLDERGMTRTELCNALGFNYSTLADWLHARKYPRIDKIEMMANFFGISKADLVEPPASSAPPPTNPSSRIKTSATYRKNSATYSTVSIRRRVLPIITVTSLWTKRPVNSYACHWRTH